MQTPHTETGFSMSSGERWIAVKQSVEDEDANNVLISDNIWNRWEYPFVIFLNNPTEDEWDEYWNIVNTIVSEDIWYSYEESRNHGLELTEEEYGQIKHLLKMVGYNILHIEVHEKENEFFPASFYIENKRRGLGKCL